MGEEVKEVMVCTSKHHPRRTSRNLPESPIRFDPDSQLGLFTEKCQKLIRKQKALLIRSRFSQNTSMNDMRAERKEKRLSVSSISTSARTEYLNENWDAHLKNLASNFIISQEQIHADV